MSYSASNRGLFRMALAGWIVALIFGPTAAQPTTQPPASIAGPPTDASAFTYPADWKLRALDGTVVPLRQWKGRVIHLTKWSTRCGPCVADLPPIEALQDSVAAQGVVFLLVSFEQAVPLRRFAQEMRLKVPVYRGAEPEPGVLRSKSTPATFVIDQTGAVVFQAEGPRGWSGNRDMIAYLRSLLQGAPPPPN